MSLNVCLMSKNLFYLCMFSFHFLKRRHDSPNVCYFIFSIKPSGINDPKMGATEKGVYLLE